MFSEVAKAHERERMGHEKKFILTFQSLDMFSRRCRAIIKWLGISVHNSMNFVTYQHHCVYLNAEYILYCEVEARIPAQTRKISDRMKDIFHNNDNVVVNKQIHTYRPNVTAADNFGAFLSNWIASFIFIFDWIPPFSHISASSTHTLPPYSWLCRLLYPLTKLYCLFMRENCFVMSCLGNWAIFIYFSLRWMTGSFHVWQKEDTQRAREAFHPKPETFLSPPHQEFIKFHRIINSIAWESKGVRVHFTTHMSLRVAHTQVVVLSVESCLFHHPNFSSFLHIAISSHCSLLRALIQLTFLSSPPLLLSTTRSFFSYFIFASLAAEYNLIFFFDSTSSLFVTK